DGRERCGKVEALELSGERRRQPTFEPNLTPESRHSRPLMLWSEQRARPAAPERHPPRVTSPLSSPRMSAQLHADLEAGARDVLERNRRSSWTCPSITLYPHQWLWDTCFIAIGLARYD